VNLSEIWRNRIVSRRAALPLYEILKSSFGELGGWVKIGLMKRSKRTG